MFYYNLIMYVVILGSIVCICHTDSEFVQILGPNITWSELEVVKEKYYLHLAVGIALGFGFSSLAIDICLFACNRVSVFHGSSVKADEGGGEDHESISLAEIEEDEQMFKIKDQKMTQIMWNLCNLIKIKLSNVVMKAFVSNVLSVMSKELEYGTFI